MWVGLTVPVRDILVGDPRRDIEHDDATLAVDVVAISQPAKFLLSCGVPHIEDDLAKVLCLCQRDQAKAHRCRSYRAEAQRVHFDAQSCNVFLFELARQVTLDKGSL